MSVMQKLLFRSTYEVDGLRLARKSLQHHAVATISRTTASVSRAALDPSDVPTLHVSTVRAASSKSASPQHLLLSAAPALYTAASVSHPVLEQLTHVPMMKAAAPKSVRPQHLPRSAAAILRTRTHVSHPASDPLDIPVPRVPKIGAAALPSDRPQQLIHSAAATLRTTASVSQLARHQLDVTRLDNRHSRQLRQPTTSEDASLTGLGPSFEDRAVFKLFTTESAKHHACVEVAEMLHMVSGSVFQMVLKQLPDFCAALNSVTGESKPLEFMDAISGGGPHCKPWGDHEELNDCERRSMTDFVF